MDNRQQTDTALLHQLNEAIRSGSLWQVEHILVEAIGRNPNDVNVWWLLSIVAKTPQEHRLYLRHVLRLDPDHGQARALLMGWSRSDPGVRHTIDELRRALFIAAQKDANNQKVASNYSPPAPSGDTLPITQKTDFDNLPYSPGAGPFVSMGQSDSALPSTPIAQARSSSNDVNSNGALLQSLPLPPTLQTDSRHSQQKWTAPSLTKPATSDTYAFSAAGSASVATANTLSPWHRGLQLLSQAGDRQTVLPIALGYLAIITVAELLTVFITVRVGILLYMGTLLFLLLHTARRLEWPDHRLWASLTLVPLIRIISLSLPLTSFSLIYWFFFTSIPLFAAAFMVMRLLDLRRRNVGLTLHGLPLQLLIALIGPVLGYIEYLILKPEALVSEPTFQQLWWPALILLVSTGFLEELIFRGILQFVSIEELGRAMGLLYAALYFAVLHVGYWSLTDVIFVFVVGLLFGWIVLKTRSIVGVTLAHGLTNISLFLIMPFLDGVDILPLFR